MAGNDFAGSLAAVKAQDPKVYDAIVAEERRQRGTLELIASENFASPAVIAAMGTILNNKYAEGYPGKRYYGGCEYVDVVETLAKERAQSLFAAEHVNVQPHSGAQANMAAYFAVTDPGATLLGMNLAHGGHLTHGHPVSFSGRFFKVVQYGVKESDQTIDYDAMDRLADEHQPKILVAGASAYPRVIDFARFGAAAKRVGATLVVDMAHIAGLVAAGLHPSPVPYADIVTTTTHKTLRGPRGGMILAKAALGPAIDKSVFPGMQGGPLMHVIAAKAVCLGEALTPGFKRYQQQVVLNAKALAAGLTARGFALVSGGTDNHLMLVDLTPKNITGRDAETALDAAGITVNKNSIPWDQKPPVTTSGIRLGTPLVTTRGMKEPEMKVIGDLICETLANGHDAAKLAALRERTKAFCAKFPMFAP